MTSVGSEPLSSLASRARHTSRSGRGARGRLLGFTRLVHAPPVLGTQAPLVQSLPYNKHGVDGAIEVLDDVEAIEDELRVGEVGLDRFDIRVPHVAAHDLHAAPAPAAEPAEEARDRVAGAVQPSPAHTRRCRSRS